MSGHTPGEWRVAGNGRHKTIRSDGDGGVYIASMSWERDDSEANARLIAASPTMLGALKEAADEMDTLFDALTDEKRQGLGPMHAPVVGRIRAAIAKAEGPS